MARVHCERENFQTVRKREPRQEAVVAAYARVQYLQQPGQAMMSRRPCTTPTPSDSIRFNFRAHNLGDAREILGNFTTHKREICAGWNGRGEGRLGRNDVVGVRAGPRNQVITHVTPELAHGRR